MRILFLCVGNSARSQMAEGLAKKILGDNVEILSAGSKPTSVHPLSIKVMAELGIDISSQSSKSVAMIDLTQIDYIITLCAEEVCPYVPGSIKKEHWSLLDPAKPCDNEMIQLKKFRDIRDELKQRISTLDLTSRVRPSNCTSKKMAENNRLMQNKTQLGIFERWLTLWVFLCMGTGIGLGHVIPRWIHPLGNLSVAQVNIPVALLIWLMIIPMLLRVDLKELHHVHQYWRGISITLFINWLIKPFSMAFLGWLFIKHIFVGLLPADQLDNYIAGLIILAAAPCTAMVFVWSYLCKGEPHFTLSQVALNDMIMIVVFAPLVGLLLGITHIVVPWATLFWSVLIYIVIPFFIAQLIRVIVLSSKGNAGLEGLLKKIHPISIIALLSMLILLFSFQGENLIREPFVVLLLAIPILIQVYFNSMAAYFLNKKCGEAYCVAGPSALIGASNFFELSVATAITLFGFQSGATLATVVGVLIEVPVMLSVVKIVNHTRIWYERS